MVREREREREGEGRVEEGTLRKNRKLRGKVETKRKSSVVNESKGQIEIHEVTPG